MLACITCARPVVFAVTGWVHRDPATDCPRLEVAWPPPGSSTDDDEDEERAVS